MAGKLRVWEVDGEDLVVDSTLRRARKEYFEHFGEVVRGVVFREVPPEEVLHMIVGGDNGDMYDITAEEFVKYGSGIWPASR